MRPSERTGVADNLWQRMMYFAKAGDQEPPHRHAHSHFTILAHGSIRVEVNGRSTDYASPHMIFIKARELHLLTALEDGTVLACTHALRDGLERDDIIDPDDVPDGVDILTIAKPLILPE